MPAAKIRSLIVRPVSSSDLSFSFGGVLSGRCALCKLGTNVPAFDFASWAKTLSTADAADGAKLAYDATRIEADLRPKSVAVIENTAERLALGQALAQREILFRERYQHIKDIAVAAKRLFPDDGTVSRTGRLEKIAALATLRQTELLQAYKNEARTGVVQGPETTTEGTGRAVTDTFLTPVRVKHSKQTINVATAGFPATTHTADELFATPEALEKKADGTTTWSELKNPDPTFLSQRVVFSDNDHKQKSRTLDIDYHHPYVDGQIAEQRNHVDLGDEVFQSTMLGLKTRSIEKILLQEVTLLDLEVARAQLRFAQTFLVSPVQGVVTAIHRDPGEWVNPGEGVVRVEDASVFLVAGLVQLRNAITVGKAVKIVCDDLFEGKQKVSLNGVIVAVRGHDSDDDEWDILVRCAGDARIPLNYNFDKDTTTLEVG